MSIIRVINDSTFGLNLGKWGEVQIGDITKDYFSPHLNLGKWGEVSLGLEIPGLKKIVPILQSSKELSWSDKTGLFDLIWKVLDPTDQYEDGGIDYQIILKRRPPFNSISLPINIQGLDAFYQPPLTPAEIKKGNIRPDNVIGSYAFYHSTRGIFDSTETPNKYQTGKAFHLFRPKLIDVSGKISWVTLDIVGNIFTFIFDKDFLDAALYPVVFDPEFGWTSTGDSEDDDTGGTLWMRTKAIAAGLSGNQIVTNIQICCRSVDGSALIRGALYNSTTGLICQGSGTVAPGTNSTWYGNSTFTGTTTINGTGSFKIGMCNNNASSYLVKYDSTGISGDCTYGTTDYTGGWPATLSDGTNTVRFSIKCIVMAAGGLSVDMWHPGMNQPYKEKLEIVGY